jgi:rare lipoprotein A (peptidoglycan hydrolase)
MKPLIAALIFCLFFSSLCFAQTQTGNASYNASKNGLTLAHASMSFGTMVRITNLRNNREVIAVVDGRIPVSDPRIADISGEAARTIGMPASGYTQVRLEELIPAQPVEPAPAVIPVRSVPPAETPPQPPPPPPPAPTETPAQTPPPAVTAVQPPSPPPPPAPTETPAQTLPPAVIAAQSPAPAAPARTPETPRSAPAAAVTPQAAAPAVTAPSPSTQESRVVETIQVITPQTPAAVVQSCFASPLGLIILILLIIVIILLTAIFVLLLGKRRLPWWPWFYPLWIRRRVRYLKKRRI